MGTETKDFLLWHFQRCEGGSINFRFLKGEEKRNHFLPLDRLTEDPRELEDLLSRTRTLNSYFGAASRNGNDGTKAGVLEIPALWVDLDGSPLSPLLEGPFLPSATVETSPGKYHCYWKLREPAGRDEIEVVEDLLRRLASYFKGDRAATDASRILRVPGTLNFKKAPPFAVKLIKVDGPEYDIADFADSDLPEVERPSPGVAGGAKGEERVRKILEGCLFLQHCDKDRRTLPEPEWFSMVSILWREPGGRELIHSLSKGHPKYSQRETDEKILHALNTPPMTCGKIRTLWDCGRDCGVKSPAALAWKAKRESPKSVGLEFPDIMAGFAGEFADTYSSFLEVPREFFYMGALTCLGNILADRIALKSEIASQPRFYTLLLGGSAYERKSTAVTKTVDFFKEAMNDFEISWGINSAEGFQKLLKNGGRLLLCFDEFKAFIGKAKIENSILLPCVNTLFESNRYQAVTKEHNLLLENVYLSILAASTIDTYENTWSSQFTDIGFNNRLFIVPGTAERKFSYPEKIPESKKAGLKSALRDVLYHASVCRELDLNPKAKESYHQWYMSLAKNPSIHARRIDTYAFRFLPLLAINEKKPVVDEETVAKATRICDWELTQRKLHDPIDADNATALMEERIRRQIKTRGEMSLRNIKRNCHADRAGIWIFETALKNLLRVREIGVSKETQKYYLLET